jgi:hypothetical protein
MISDKISLTVVLIGTGSRACVFFMFTKPEAADVCQDLHDCSIDHNRK